MLNLIWLILIISSIVVSFFTGQTTELVAAVTASAKSAMSLLLVVSGVLVLWTGLMQIAERAGLVEYLAKFLRPLLSCLFPQLPPQGPAIQAITLNMTANLLGLGSAATPFGLKAMEALQALNQGRKEASDAMCTFLAVNTSSIQLIPATAIGFLAAAGGTRPTDIVVTSFLASLAALTMALCCAKLFSRSRRFVSSLSLEGSQS